MPTKIAIDQGLERRVPKQERALQKIELIFEATMRLLERDGAQQVTTNAIAARAGLSIGTLYQYFSSKEAILDALTEREMKTLSDRLLASMSSPPPARSGDRIPLVVDAVVNSYGGRRSVHRHLLEYAMTRGKANRLTPLFQLMVERLGSGLIAPGADAPRTLSTTDAFVLTHAIAGVMRGLVSDNGHDIDRQEISRCLAALVSSYLTAEEKTLPGRAAVDGHMGPSLPATD